MMTSWLGALLGLLGGLGLVATARFAPPMRRMTMSERIAPYLMDTRLPSRLLTGSGKTPMGGGVTRIGSAVLARVTSRLERTVGGSASIGRRLAALGHDGSVEEFRIEQVRWGCAGALISGLLMWILSGVGDGVDVIFGLFAAFGGAIAGGLARDWWLGHQLRRREERIMAELPVVTDLLALSVTAGEAPFDALNRVCRITAGEVAADLSRALDAARAGLPVVTALAELAERTGSEPFGRFLQGVVVAIERGTPLADVLRAQATDVREQSKRALLEAGGQKELHMMVPVVFLILPVTVLFALYPGLTTLTSLSS
ncbi:MAG: Type secretion system protein [Frankiales bacterium]|nr:Type secretion system protein [Frankiales bacterium]